MNQHMERFVLGGTQPLGDNEIGVIAASSELARDGHVLVVKGLSLDNYKKNPIVLWSHNVEEPIGACTAVGIVGDDLAARIELSEASAKAQEIRAFAKGGIVKGVSIGFDVIDAEPLRDNRGGMRITASELMEISIVSIGADVNASIVARGHKARPGAVAALRGLPSLSAAAVRRALSQVGRGPPQGAKPFALLSPMEQMAAYQRQRSSHVLAVWGLQQGERELERDSSREQRQADLLRLAPGGRGH
jgi:HK97 family phage prohead protease